MTASIIKVGYQYRWLVMVHGKADGGTSATWEEALAASVRAGDAIRKER